MPPAFLSQEPDYDRCCPPSVVVAGELVARTYTWTITTDTDIKYIYPTLPTGETIRVAHITHRITWYNSRQEASRFRKTAWHTQLKLVSSDWRSPAISRSEVVSEVARMGGGDQAEAIVASVIN